MNRHHPTPFTPPSTDTKRLAQLLNAIMLIAMFLFSILVYDSLPEKIPIHFNIKGVADYWQNKSFWSWMSFALVGLSMNCFIYASSWLIKLAKKHPSLLSIPMKKQFLRLPAEAQEPIWKKTFSYLSWMAVPLNMLFLFVIIAIYMVATEQFSTLPLWPILLFLGLEGGIIILWIVILYRSIRSAVRSHSIQNEVI